MRKGFRQDGATLIELLVSIVISLIIVSAMLGMYVTTTANSSELLKSSKLNQELSSLMTVMTNDIRRAGINGTALADPAANIFWQSGETLLIVTNANACILYSYDADLDGSLDIDLNGDGTPDAYELYGFRQNGNLVEMLEFGASDTHNNACADGTGSWKQLTDADNVKVTDLRFVLTADDTNCINRDDPATACSSAASGQTLVQTQMVTIELEGELSSDSSVRHTFEPTTVRVRNDRVELAP